MKHSRHGETPGDAPPEWQGIDLPDPSVLHRHLAFDHADVGHVGLGGLCSMATRTSDQHLVKQFAYDHGRCSQDGPDEGARVSANVTESVRESKRRRRQGPEVIACFGYHPWFCHLLHVQDTAPSKSEHYASLFLPDPSSPRYHEHAKLLNDMVDRLPEPRALKPLIEEIKTHVSQVVSRGGLVMLGEVGLDKSFRVPYPSVAADSRTARECECGESSATSIDTSSQPSIAQAESNLAVSAEQEVAQDQQDNNTSTSNNNKPTNPLEPPAQRSKNLSPFRPSMTHQLAVLELQMDLAVELGINVSLHSVKAQGPTLDFLTRFQKKHGPGFTRHVNVDLHSCGGWSVESWVSAEKRFPNLYLSPSIAISGQTPVTPHLIRAADPARLLVESDTHLIAHTTPRVWAAVVWIARCRGWRIERTEAEFRDDDGRSSSDDDNEPGVVRRLQSNWDRFMKL